MNLSLGKKQCRFYRYGFFFLNDIVFCQTASKTASKNEGSKKTKEKNEGNIETKVKRMKEISAVIFTYCKFLR